MARITGAVSAGLGALNNKVGGASNTGSSAVKNSGNKTSGASKGGSTGITLGYFADRNANRDGGSSSSSGSSGNRNTGSSSGRGSSSSGTGATKVLGAYTGGVGSASSGGGYTGMKASDYLKTNYKTGADYGSSGHSDAVGRLKNGMMVNREYLLNNPDDTIYPLSYKRTNYTSTVDDQGNLYNHRGEKWGEGGVWTYDELPDYAKARMDWNYGVTPGQSYPTDSAAYNDAYNWYNSVYGVASDDTHPLSAGQASGQGSYWLAGGDGYNNRPTYTPLSLEYSAPSGGGYAQGVNSNTAYTVGNGTGNVTPNTGANSSYNALLRQAQQAALDANDASVRSATLAYENQIPTINQQADEAARQAYIAMMQGQTELPQQMAAMGYGGGLTESSLLGLTTNYENNRNDILNSKNDALRQLDLQIAQLEAQGDMNAANILAQFRQQEAQALLAQQQAEADRQWQQYMAQYENNLAMQRDEAQAALNQKYKSSSGGGSSSGYTINELIKLWEAGAITDDQLGKLSGIPVSTEASTLESPLESLVNGNGNGWIYVSGLGRMTPLEVYNAVQRGEIVETNSNGKVSYRKA